MDVFPFYAYLWKACNPSLFLTKRFEWKVCVFGKVFKSASLNRFCLSVPWVQTLRQIVFNFFKVDAIALNCLSVSKVNLFFEQIKRSKITSKIEFCVTLTLFFYIFYLISQSFMIFSFNSNCFRTNSIHPLVLPLSFIHSQLLCKGILQKQLLGVNYFRYLPKERYYYY